MDAVVLLLMCLCAQVCSFTFDTIKPNFLNLKDQLKTETEAQGNIKSKLDEVVHMVEVLQNRSSLQAEAEEEKEKDQQTMKTALGDLLTKYNTIQTELVKKEDTVQGISSRLDAFQSTVGKLAKNVEEKDDETMKSALSDLLANYNSIQTELEKDDEIMKNALGDLLTKYNTIETKLVKKDEAAKDMATKLDTVQSSVGKLAKEVEDWKRCGPVPDVMNADVNYDDKRMGAEAVYTCKPDFRQCGTNSKIRCLAAVDWERPSLSCEQVRWTNSKVEFSERLPCGELTKRKILITGTPTKETAMDFSLFRDEDVLFLTSIRFSRSGDLRKVVFNAKIDNHWMTEKRTDIFPFHLHQTFTLEITLEDGVYKVMANGEHLITRPEQIVDGKAKGLSITGDLSIDKVEIEY